MLQLQSSEFILPKAKESRGDDACKFTLIDNAVLVAVLCDGVGSARKGGAAARQCVNYFIDQFAKRPKNWDMERTIRVFTQHINRLLFKESMTQYEKIELLTTLCVAVIEGDTLYTANLGDSRIYLLKHAEDQMRRLSTDHTMDEEHMSHVLTQACGLNEHVEVAVTQTKIAAGDTLVLCSDGVYNLLEETLFAEQLQKGLSARLIVNAAAKEHKENERDDMSLQIFRIEALDELFAIRNVDLPIPSEPKEGESYDGYVLQSPMMPHRRIWRVLKEGRAYVLKFPMASDDEALEAFVREAWYAKQVHHKAFGSAWVPEERSARYYVMELVEGTNLLEYLKNNTLSIDDAISLAKFLHRAEAHLLHLGLVHGDIKPENIIVYQNANEAGVAFKMVDFGSVVEIFSESSRAGTPSYLAPERFTGSAINEATELFSIGVTLYWALSGKFPYGEIEPFQTPSFRQAKAPSRYNKNIPPWLDAVILRAIAVAPDERYRHYSEFFYELKSPENVKPYFAKETPLIEREPLMFYKVGFFAMLALNLVILLYFSR